MATPGQQPTNNAFISPLVSDPIQREQLIHKLRLSHQALQKAGKGGFPSAEDDCFSAFKTIYRDLPILKDIPANFRLKLANVFEAVTFNSFDKILDMSEKTHLYILLSGEALIIQSQKQFEQLQDYNLILNKELAASTINEVGEESHREYQEMNDDEFFAQQMNAAHRNTGLGPAQSQGSGAGLGQTPLSDYQDTLQKLQSSVESRLSIREQRLSIKIKNQTQIHLLSIIQQLQLVMPIIQELAWAQVEEQYSDQVTIYDTGRLLWQTGSLFKYLSGAYVPPYAPRHACRLKLILLLNGQIPYLSCLQIIRVLDTSMDTVRDRIKAQNLHSLLGPKGVAFPRVLINTLKPWHLIRLISSGKVSLRHYECYEQLEKRQGR